MSTLRSGPATVTATWLCLFVGASPVVVFTFGNFIAALSKDFGWSRALLSAAFATGALAAAISVPILGRLIDRWGLRTVTLAGIAFAALVVALQALNNGTPWLLFVLQAAVGAGTIALTPLPYSKAIVGWYDRRRGLAFGLAALGGAFGAAIVPQIAQRVIAAEGWRTAYVVLGSLVMLVGFLPAALLLHDRPAPAGRSDAAAVRGLTIREGRRSWKLWVICLVFVLAAAGTAGPIGQFVPLLIDRGIPVAQATGAIAAFAIANGVSRLISGILLDRIDAARLAAATFLLAAFGVTILYVSTSLSAAYVAAALCGIAVGFEADLLPFLVSRYIGEKAFGELVGYGYLAFSLGTGTVGPLLIGNAHTFTGGYGPALIVFAIFLVIASVLLLTLGPYTFPARDAGTVPSADTPVAATPLAGTDR